MVTTKEVQPTVLGGDPAKHGLPNLPIFKGLTSATLQLISSYARTRSLDSGSTLYKAAESAEGVFILTEGSVRRYSLVGVRDTTLSVITPGGLFGHSALVTQTRATSATALEESRVLYFPVDDFRSLLETCPDFALNVLQTSIKQSMELETRIAGFSGKWSYRRLAIALRELANREGHRQADGSIKILSKVTQEDLANIIGSARETVVIQFRRLRAAGAIKTQGRTIFVVPKKLEEFIAEE